MHHPKRKAQTAETERAFINKQKYESKISNFWLVESRLLQFLLSFTFYFKSRTKDGTSNAASYLKGLIVSRRRNYQVMAQELQNSSQQCLHHFITNGKWCYSKLMDRITVDFGCLFATEWT
ncbi:hypothetical protein DXN04_15735 [Chitinophaga silvisoli]|uniref:Uncharacterized protein n=1 Tax=Chitinophaga silvisoli TaxID=2291814 RepID=A0A3E1P3G5_9BACT|nr:hypothetical protein DXN04_15735 [Chitinophaga silvisoli]